MHIASFALATAVCYVLAVFAVIAAPVPPAPGVSALYIAAAVYVPLAIWMGMWGCLAGYLSCFFLGLVPSGYSPLFSFVWSWCDFLEGLMPLLFFRLLRIDPDFSVKKPKFIKVMAPLVVTGAGLVIVGALINYYLGVFGHPFTTIALALMYCGIVLAIIGIVIGALAGDVKTWVTYIISGIVLASVVSGLWGAGTLCLVPGLSPLYGKAPFTIVFTGWVIGDMIVLSTIGTALLVTLTPLIKRTPIYVRGWFS